MRENSLKRMDFPLKTGAVVTYEHRGLPELTISTKPSTFAFTHINAIGRCVPVGMFFKSWRV